MRLNLGKECRIKASAEIRACLPYSRNCRFSPVEKTDHTRMEVALRSHGCNRPFEPDLYTQ